MGDTVQRKRTPVSLKPPDEARDSAVSTDPF